MLLCEEDGRKLDVQNTNHIYGLHPVRGTYLDELDIFVYRIRSMFWVWSLAGERRRLARWPHRARGEEVCWLFCIFGTEGHQCWKWVCRTTMSKQGIWNAPNSGGPINYRIGHDKQNKSWASTTWLKEFKSTENTTLG